MGVLDFFIQSYFIPKPTLTKENLPDQSGIYVAGRSPEKAEAAISKLKSEFPNSTGSLSFLKVDFSDFSTIEPEAEEFLSKETRLDVLTNNAGVMIPPLGSKDKHGHELQIGTNMLGPYLFTKLLVPIVKSTVAKAPAGSVRITWGSSGVATTSPENGMIFDADGNLEQGSSPQVDYTVSEAANFYLASQFARLYAKDGIISVSWNPGNLETDLQSHANWIQKFIMSFVTHPARFGGYTEPWAGWSPAITASHKGAYIAPWGRIYPARKDIQAGTMSKEEGGTGYAERFLAYCEKETAAFA
ncbi:NAD(P)-binding protein [Aaosphaeria arxii CBS 175.79]|uniref:NAD(P)-binding protein n=1 Tax=Aaosphaeria arxii CBS 175.79 TaxID=1450172 RepID=A0A6A5XBH8_9PLEO|nr:NAD(P)-binding protein [Aaosphaeria arxii CBS 175.79]KAF2010263.1 NAD(P)-binding protein [Aaosphaeria arxii CBS 175.79]